MNFRRVEFWKLREIELGGAADANVHAPWESQTGKSHRSIIVIQKSFSEASFYQILLLSTTDERYCHREVKKHRVLRVY